MLSLPVCAVFVCVYMSVCACVHWCGQACVFSNDSPPHHCRTFISGPQTPSADPAHFASAAISRSSSPSIHCFLTLPLARLLSHSLHITVTPFHLILKPLISPLSHLLGSISSSSESPGLQPHYHCHLPFHPCSPLHRTPTHYPHFPSSLSSCLIFLIFCSSRLLNLSASQY